MISFGFSCVAVVLLAASIMVLTLLIAGRRDPSRPCCSACRAEAPPITIMRGEPCPHCGAPLTADGAVTLARRSASRTTWIMFAIIVLLWPLIILFPMFVAQRMAGGRAPMMPAMRGGASSALTTDALVAAVVAESNGASTALTEFIRRREANEIDLAATRTALLKELPLLDPRWISTPQPGALVIAQAILEANPDDTEVMDAILTAFQPDPQARVAMQRPNMLGIVIEPSPRSRNAVRTIQPMLFLRRVMADDRSIPFSSMNGGIPVPALLITQMQKGVHLDPADVGDAKELTFIFDLLLLDWFDAQRAGGAFWSGAAPEDWPPAMHSQQRRVTLPLDGAATAPAP